MYCLYDRFFFLCAVSKKKKKERDSKKNRLGILKLLKNFNCLEIFFQLGKFLTIKGNVRLWLTQDLK